MKLSLPFLIVLVQVASCGLAPAQSGNQPRQQNKPVERFFHDIAGEVKYQRANFWDGMKGLKQDVRRAFGGETVKQKQAREREQYLAMEREYAHRFGYGSTKPATARSTGSAAPAPSNGRPVPMDDRFIRSSSPPPLTPVRKAATNPPAQPSARQDQPSIVRPNPPVSASLTAPPASGTTSTPPPKKTESTTGKEKPEAKPDPEIDPDAVTVVKEKSPATNPPPKKEEKSLEKIDEAARQYPAATATGKDGIVLSPFPPHEELDVTGMKTGDLAIDPGNGRIFRVP